MRNVMKLSIIIVVVIISVTAFVVEYIDHSVSEEIAEEKNDQEKAEDFAEKMKPKVEEHLHKRDIHNFIKTITFEKDVTINPMGDIIIDGYINNEPEKYGFSASLQYRAKKIGSMSYDPELSYRFKDWDKFKDEPELKENYLKRLSEKEREQYLKDIGEK
ncbi:DUF1433 domain-containing protein [Bacillus pumilus]|uniref:DUF1433 domain-containing protein n=1 Tax=Bacillus pumilus TaxID=1408 RepID=UPI002041FE28|nr:DUF1433 domain-containing protein [Bacillus pumilus]MCM3147819.1 DUF1433 domain-containing protein [Bacillus pumilus]